MQLTSRPSTHIPEFTTKRVSFPFWGLSLPNSERVLARARSSQNGNHNLGLGVPPKTEPRSASSSTHFSSNHHHHHPLFPFPFPLHPSTRPYPRTKTMATRKRRGDRKEDNKKGGRKGALAIFYLFFFVSDATAGTWGGFDPPHLCSMRQRDSRVPSAPVSGSGHPLRWFRRQREGDHPLPACFRCQRGGWTPPSLFLTQQGEGPPSLLVSRATQRG